VNDTPATKAPMSVSDLGLTDDTFVSIVSRFHRASLYQVIQKTNVKPKIPRNTSM